MRRNRWRFTMLAGFFLLVAVALSMACGAAAPPAPPKQVPSEITTAASSTIEILDSYGVNNHTIVVFYDKKRNLTCVISNRYSYSGDLECFEGKLDASTR